MYYLKIDIAKKYATSIFYIIKREEIKQGTWPYPEDIRFKDWILQEMGPNAVNLIHKQIPEMLPQDMGIYKEIIEPIALSDPNKKGKNDV